MGHRYAASPSSLISSVSHCGHCVANTVGTDPTGRLSTSTFTIFGIDGTRDRAYADPLLTDFAFVDYSEDKFVGLRIEGLPAGVWDAISWHYDSLGHPGNVQIQLRIPGGSTELLGGGGSYSFSPNPINYSFVSDGSSVYELLYKPMAAPDWRSRLNGLQIWRRVQN